MKWQTDLDEVWLVVSPQNPLKKKQTLLNEYNRLHLVELSIEHYPYLRASNIEFSLPQPSYTIDTLIFLGEKFPERTFVPIIGSDNIASLPKWKNHEALMKHYEFYCYKRNGSANYESIPDNIKIFDFPQIEISSTYIRNCIKSAVPIDFLVPERVADYIRDYNLYK